MVWKGASFQPLGPLGRPLYGVTWKKWPWLSSSSQAEHGRAASTRQSLIPQIWREQQALILQQWKVLILFHSFRLEIASELPFYKATCMIAKFWEWNSVPAMTPKLRFVTQGTVIVPWWPMEVSSATGDWKVISAGQPRCIHLEWAKALATWIRSSLTATVVWTHS